MSGRQRNASATREAILEAAREAFTTHGYIGAGVREIAAAVGVHPSLVNRYFGSKERLFDEAVPATFDIRPFLTRPASDVPAALARYIVEKERGSFDATLAMVRSAGSPEASALLRRGLERGFIEPLASWLGGPYARERAGLILAALAGVAISRDVLAVNALTDREAVADQLTRLIESLVQGCHGSCR